MDHEIFSSKEGGQCIHCTTQLFLGGYDHEVK